jgi:hypothetical protein
MFFHRLPWLVIEICGSKLSFYCNIFLLQYLFIALSFYRNIFLSQYLFIAISFYHIFFLSQYLFIAISFYRNIFLSQYLFIAISFYRNIEILCPKMSSVHKPLALKQSVFSFKSA